MNFFRSHKNRVADLDEWLEIATKKLARPARRRVRLEIKTHYAEAVAAHQAAGSGEHAARVVALEELGDAKAAAKCFRKRHLTEAEVKFVGGIVESAKSMVLLAVGHITFAFFAYRRLSLSQGWSLLHRSPYDWFLVAMGFLVLVVLPTTSFILASRKGAKLNIRLLVLMRSLCGVNTAFVFIFLGDRHSDDLLTIFLICTWALGIPFGLRFWNKLGKVSRNFGRNVS